MPAIDFVMKLPQRRFLHTTSARLALLYACLFILSALIVFSVIYWSASTTLSHLVDANLKEEWGDIKDEAGQSIEGFANVVTGQMRRRDSGYRYLLQDESGAIIASNLPPTMPRLMGFSDVELPAESPSTKSRTFRAFGKPTAGNGLLIIVDRARALDKLHILMIRSFFWGGGVALLLAIAGSAAMLAGVLRRVEAINRTSERIMLGDIHERLPVRSTHGAGDEFDRLAENLNRTLDRVEHLIGGLQRVSSDIAHDLRTPLSRLRHTLEIAYDAMERDGAPDQLVSISRAISEVDALLATFSALLRIAQMEAGAVRRSFESVDLSTVVADVVDVYRPAAEEKGQTITADIPAGVIVSGDRALMTQLVANLVENSVRHSFPASRIDIVLKAGGDNPGVRLTIADDGPGIPKSEHTNVFRRFYRLDESRGAPGNGLGLSLVAAIGELHGVALKLDENRPRGLRVDLAFPRQGSGQ